MQEAYVVLWWVRERHRPTMLEAIARLEFLRKNGPTEEAFTFRHAFLPPDAMQPQSPFGFGNECPAT